MNTIFPQLSGSYFGGIAHVVDSIIDAPGARVISPIDEFTKTLGYRGYLTMMQLKEIRARLSAGTLKPGEAEKVMQDLMSNPDPSMQQAAEDWAHRMTFQSPFPDGGPGQAFQTLLNKAPVLRFIFPFMRTATNIFKQSIVERTPLALFSARIRQQMRRRFRGGSCQGAHRHRYCDRQHARLDGDSRSHHGRCPERPQRASRVATGWSHAVLHPHHQPDHRQGHLALICVVRADGDGGRSYCGSVKLMSYIHADDDAYSMSSEDSRATRSWRISWRPSSRTPATRHSCKGRPSSRRCTMTRSAHSVCGRTRWARTCSPSPDATKFVRNEQDPYMRQAFTLLDKVKDQLPTGLGVKGSKTLPLRLDVFGQPRMRSGDNTILGPLNPLPGNTSKKDPVTDEIQKFDGGYAHRADHDAFAAACHRWSGQRYARRPGHALTPAEYQDYVQMSRADPIFQAARSLSGTCWRRK